MRQDKNHAIQKTSPPNLIIDLLSALESSRKYNNDPSTSEKDAFQPLGKQIGQILAVKNLLYGVLQLPLELRNFLDAVLAVSEGKSGWFECPDLKLAAQLLGDPEEDGHSNGSLKKRIQRLRKKLMEWQERKNYRLVDIDPGHSKYGRDLENNIDTSYLEYHATQYRLPILPVLEVILRDCISGQKWSNLDVMKSIVERHVNGLAAKPVYPDSGGYKNPGKQFMRLKRQGISAIIRCLQHYKINGGSPSELLEQIESEIETKAKDLLASEFEQGADDLANLQTIQTPNGVFVHIK